MKKKLGYTWYAHDWETSELFQEFRSKPTAIAIIRMIFDRLYTGNGRALITQATVSAYFYGSQHIDRYYPAIAQRFTIDNAGYWTHETVTKRLRISEINSENRKSGYARTTDRSTDSEIRSTSRTVKEKEKEKEKRFPSTDFSSGADGGSSGATTANQPTQKKMDAGGPDESHIITRYIEAIFLWEKFIPADLELTVIEKQAAIRHFLNWIDDQGKLKGKPIAAIKTHFKNWVVNSTEMIRSGDWTEKAHDEFRADLHWAKKDYKPIQKK